MDSYGGCSGEVSVESEDLSRISAAGQDASALSPCGSLAEDAACVCAAAAFHPAPVADQAETYIHPEIDHTHHFYKSNNGGNSALAPPTIEIACRSDTSGKGWAATTAEGSADPSASMPGACSASGAVGANLRLREPGAVANETWLESRIPAPPPNLSATSTPVSAVQATMLETQIDGDPLSLDGLIEWSRNLCPDDVDTNLSLVDLLS